MIHFHRYGNRDDLWIEPSRVFAVYPSSEGTAIRSIGTAIEHVAEPVRLVVSMLENESDDD